MSNVNVNPQTWGWLRIIAFICAIVACVIAAFVWGEAGFAKEEPFKWLAGGAFIGFIGLVLLAVPS